MRRLILLVAWLSAWLRKPPHPPRKPFDLGTPVLNLGGGDVVSLGDACSGVSITGAVGSGKTSAPGAHIAEALLDIGCGFLVFTAKSNEYQRWVDLCRRTKREADLIRVYPGGPNVCDFLAYEMSQSGASIESSCQLLDALVERMSRQSGKAGDEIFWLMSSHRLMQSAMTLPYLLDGKVSLDTMYRIILTAPTEPAQIASRDWQMTNCGRLCVEAKARMDEMRGGKRRDLRMAIDMIDEISSWSDKTRGIVVSMVVNTLSRFLGGDIFDLCSNGEVTVSPDDVKRGKVVVLDVSILQYREVGMAIQLIWKQIMQRAILRDMQERPVVLWADEAQFFSMPDQDVKFATVSREHRGISVMMFQNFEVMIDAMGGDHRAEKQLSGLMGNHVLKISCANSSNETNEFYEKLFGSSWKRVMGGGMSPGDYNQFQDLVMGNGPKPNLSFSPHWHPEVPASSFSRLSKGGPSNDMKVQAYVYLGGRVWRGSGKIWKLVTFPQLV